MEQENNNIDSTAFEKYLNETEVRFVYEQLPLPWYRRLFRKLFRKKSKRPKGVSVRQAILTGDFSKMSDEESLEVIKIWGIK